jgi:hypothetical protein
MTGNRKKHYSELQSEGEIKEAIRASLAESKACGPKPPYFRWDAWPAGNIANRNWRSGEGHRRAERRYLRRKLKQLRRFEHCTSPHLRYCDCDWCRFLQGKRRSAPAMITR